MASKDAVRATEISFAVGHNTLGPRDNGPLITPVIRDAGASTTHHDNSIVSVGWDTQDRAQGRLPDSIVEGLDNQDLWLLMRRFNKHVFHIKATSRPMLPGDLDFSTSPDEDFSSNKLRAQLERLYIGIVIGTLGFLQHFARLRSWKEPRRTGILFVIYYTAWYLQLVIPTVFAILAALVISPRLRRVMFPPAPRSMVNVVTGEIQHPPSGILATADSATGAPEAYKGEALENEASNFAASVIGTAMNVLNDVVEPQHGVDRDKILTYHYFHSDEAALDAAAATSANGPHGMKGSSVARGGQPSGGTSNAEKRMAKPTMLEPHALATKVAVAKDKAGGIERPSRDKSKIPIQKMIWRATQALTHGLGQLSDYWERCANLVNPKPPFVQKKGQYQLAGALAAGSAVTACVSLHTMFRVFTFMGGVLIFGRPLLIYIQEQLVANDATLRRTIFHGVPTDAQQTIAILRLGESARVPIPPPPPSGLVGTPASSGPNSGASTPRPPGSSDYHHEKAAIDDPVNLDASFNDKPLGMTPAELRRVARTDRAKVHDNSPHDHVLEDEESHGRVLSKVFGMLKVGVRGIARTAVAADAARAKTVKSKSAVLRLGCADEEDDDKGKHGPLLAPVEFKARYEGKKGFLYLTTDDAGPSLCFTRKRGVTASSAPEIHVDSDDDDDEDDEDVKDTGDMNHLSSQAIGALRPIWTLPIEEIAELNKFSGYGEKAKVLAGWALDTAIKDGLQIIDRHGRIRLVTAMPKRDELFNRLCAMGHQRWEVW